METQPRFDLSVAIQNWSRELAAEPDLTPEVCRELETHLRDTVAELQRRGLNDQESFWLARKRIGQPKELREEFVKADFIKAWKERLVWILCALLAFRVWGDLSSIVLSSCRWLGMYLFGKHLFLPDWVFFYIPLPSQWAMQNLFENPLFIALLLDAPIICIIILLSHGRFARFISASQALFNSRRRFLTWASPMFLIYCVLRLLVLAQYARGIGPSISGNPSVKFVAFGTLGSLVWPGALIALIAWLLPAQTRNSSKQT
jgi:hypothetical protein